MANSENLLRSDGNLIVGVRAFLQQSPEVGAQAPQHSRSRRRRKTRRDLIGGLSVARVALCVAGAPLNGHIPFASPLQSMSDASRGVWRLCIWLWWLIQASNEGTVTSGAATDIGWCFHRLWQILRSMDGDATIGDKSDQIVQYRIR
jgi:hypothetical protein